MIRLLAILLSLFSAGLSSLLLLHPGRARLRVILWIPRLLAGAYAPLLALAGALGALLGTLRRQRLAVLAGLSGAFLSVRHIWRVTRPHTGFQQAFGPDWMARLPPELRRQLQPKRWQPLAPPAPSVPWQRDVTIAKDPINGAPLMADIWYPPREVPPSGVGVLYFHGSGWHYLDKDFGTRYAFQRLAAQGHLVVDVAYTLAPQADVMDMATEVKQAIAWLKSNARRFGVDPARVVLMGGSAGGQLSLLAAYTPNDPEYQPSDISVDTSVRGVIAFYAPADLASLYEMVRERFDHTLSGDNLLERRFARLWEQLVRRPYVPPAEWVPSVMGGTPEDVPEMYFRASPINHVGPHCPPTLLLQGAQDLTMTCPDTERLYHALQAAGVPAILVEFPNTEHIFDLVRPRLSPAAQAAEQDVERFLAVMAGGKSSVVSEQ